jgi:hypothetical protein
MKEVVGKGFSQRALLALDCRMDSADVEFLGWLHDAIGTRGMDNIGRKVEGEDLLYTWVNHDYVVSDLEIMRLGVRSVRARLDKYVKSGVLVKIHVANKEQRGSRAYYAYGPKWNGIRFNWEEYRKGKCSANSMTLEERPPATQCQSKERPPATQCQSKERPPATQCQSDTYGIKNTIARRDHRGVPEKDLSKKEKDVYDSARKIFEEMGWIAELSANAGKEIEGLRAIAKFCAKREDPTELLTKLLVKFKNLKESRNKFYAKFLFSPKSINSLLDSLMGLLEAEKTTQRVGQRPDYKGLI